MNKRGQVSTVFVIYSLVAAFFILITAITIARTSATGEDVRQSYLAKDVALTIDAFQAVPGDVSENYVTENFTQNIKVNANSETGTVVVTPELGPQTQYSFRPGIPVLRFSSFTIEAKKSLNLEMSKTGSLITISKRSNG